MSRKVAIPMIRRADGSPAKSTMEAAEIFSESFSGNFSTEPDVLPTLITQCTVDSMCDVEFSPEQVERRLNQLGVTIARVRTEYPAKF